jgi:peptidoglycan/LPS O-acetylase OafA/YrhL
MNHPIAPRGTRLPGLDILRAVAVVLVFGRHLMPLTNDNSRLVLRFAHTWKRAAVGTDIFFVLSGFLVAGLLFRDYQRNGCLHIGNFLARRGFKIYPAYLLYMAASIPLAMLLGSDAPTAGQTLAHSFFLQNYYPHFLEYWGHLWSVAVEEHFYFAIALLALLMFAVPRFVRPGENPFRWIPAAFTVIAVILLVWRCALATQAPFGFYTNYVPTHLRFDALFFGVLLSYWYHFHREAFVQNVTRHKTALWLIGIAGLVPAFAVGLDNPFSYSLGFTLYYLATGAIIAATVVSPINPGALIARAGTYLATRSYSIYLWHMLVFMAVRRFFITTEPALGSIWIINMATTITAALAVGIVMANVFELPILRLRERWSPRPTAHARPVLPAATIELEPAVAAP